MSSPTVNAWAWIASRGLRGDAIGVHAQRGRSETPNSASIRARTAAGRGWPLPQRRERLARPPDPRHRSRRDPAHGDTACRHGARRRLSIVSLDRAVVGSGERPLARRGQWRPSSRARRCIARPLVGLERGGWRLQRAQSARRACACRRSCAASSACVVCALDARRSRARGRFPRFAEVATM